VFLKLALVKIMTEIIKVILADDHETILNSVSTLLNSSPYIEVVSTAEDGVKAIDLARSSQADVLILDLDMPELNGLQVSAKLRSMNIDVKILILSIYSNPSIVEAAIRLGASGYVLKNRAVADLVTAVHTVAGGDQFLSPPLETLAA
jgi:two-component system response regulator DegU